METMEQEEEKIVRVPITPPINTEGVFTCHSPFELDTNLIFKCDAIRSFPELERRGIDVYDTYYKPYGLSSSIWEEDTKLNASILTLKGVDDTVVYIPNTYLESYPGMAGLAYAHNVIVLDVGLVPATIDVMRVAEEVKDTAKKGLGVEVEVKLDTMRYTGNITHEEHVLMETARRDALNKYTPIYEQLENYKLENETLRAKIDELIAIIAER